MTLPVHSEVPSSARSREASARVRPGLEERLAEKGLRWGSPIFIRIFKEPAVLEVWIEKRSRFELFETYPVCRFSGDLGPKIREGDGQAPEGFYFVSPAQMNPSSNYHLAFNIGYPNAYDRHHNRTGSAIMVHGSCVSIGCFAMTDAGIEEIYSLAEAALNNGQRFFRVHIFPFRMSEAEIEKRMSRRALIFESPHSQWRDFWRNLLEGYEIFERTRIPPDVTVRAGRYDFR